MTVGLGNVLSAYCYYYLFSMFNKQDFDFKTCIFNVKWKSKAEQMFQVKKKHKLLRHLPWKLPFDKWRINIDDSIAIYETVDTCGLFFHLRTHGILENIHNIRQIIKTALTFENDHFDFHPDDVVIHIRTGDIFSNKHSAFYSSLHFENYVTLLKDKIINNIYIVWKSDRPQDLEYDKYNNALIQCLKDFLCTRLKCANVITDQQNCDDFVFMTKAPFLIACISTYSMWAALLNTNTAIIPQSYNTFNNRLFTGDYFKIVPLSTLKNYKTDITEFCNQFTNPEKQEKIVCKIVQTEKKTATSTSVRGKRGRK